MLVISYWSIWPARGGRVSCGLGKALLCCGSGGPVGDWVKQSFGFKLND